MQTAQIILASRPSGCPTLENFREETSHLPNLGNAQVRLRSLYFSVDPYMRMRMDDNRDSYIPPFEVNQMLNGGAVAQVIESTHPEYKIGDTVVGMLPWARESIVSGTGLQHIDPNSISPSYFLGILGMPGLTAYFGMTEICKPKQGETLVVSGAAGAVGLVVGQIGKIKGARVVGIAGTDEKIKILKEKYGYDDVINYKKTSDIKAALSSACSNGIDMYFDNVGGEISDAVLSHINKNARVAVCGQISLYNDIKTSFGPRFLPIILIKSALVKGFLVFDFFERYPEGIAQLSEWVQDGQLQFEETIIEGFEKLPEALLGLFSGKNIGKMIVKV